MNRRTSLRRRLLGIGRDYDERRPASVGYYMWVPAPKKRRHRAARQAVMDGQTIVLLTFLLLVVLGTLLTAPIPSSAMRQVAPITSAPR